MKQHHHLFKDLRFSDNSTASSSGVTSANSIFKKLLTFCKRFLTDKINNFIEPITSTRISKNQPTSSRLVLKLAIVIIFVLALLSGYYQVQFSAERKRYLRLEDMFVRVRSQLGREATQDLIDASYHPLDE
jgi:hypothetical protein